MTYRRLPDAAVDAAALEWYRQQRQAAQQQDAPILGHKNTADDLNSFRRQVCW